MMPPKKTTVYLNSFCLKTLDDGDKTVRVYGCIFKRSLSESDIVPQLNRIIYKLWMPAVGYHQRIIAFDAIAEGKLNTEDYQLTPEGTQELDPNNESDRQALERLHRKQLRHHLQRLSYKSPKDYVIESSGVNGFVWWNRTETAIANEAEGWAVHRGYHLDVKVTRGGKLFLEIDTHHRLYTPWTLAQWLERHPELSPSSFSYLRNTYDHRTWKNPHIVHDQTPETLIIPGLNKTLAAYHRELQPHPATLAEIQQGQVIEVQSPGRRGPQAKTFHLSSRVRPCVSLDLMAFLVQKGDRQAKKIFRQIKPTITQRLQEAQTIAQYLGTRCYGLENTVASEIAPLALTDIQILKIPPQCLRGHHNQPLKRVADSLHTGCFRGGELQFGCLNLSDRPGWPPYIQRQLQQLGRIHGLALEAQSHRTGAELPENSLERDQFWRSWREEGIETVLVVAPVQTPWNKIDLTREALAHGIAMQFMRPLVIAPTRAPRNPNPPLSTGDRYRMQNVLLGLLAKAGWQAVGFYQPFMENFADLAIGFDAGRNETLSYGSSSFAVLSSGQTLGWELPEAQKSETISGQHISQSVLNIIAQYKTATQNPKPRRILLMRDGLIQQEEFQELCRTLEASHIAYDLISVRKSGAGRMAVIDANNLGHQETPGKFTYRDAPRGTIVISGQDKCRIVTSEAKAGGSSRPLLIVREAGNTPIADLATQIYALTQLHPASASFTSRLPMPLHYADKLAKKVQALGSTAVLQNISKKKLFFI